MYGRRALLHAVVVVGAFLVSAAVLDRLPVVNSDTLLPISYIWDVVHRVDAWRTHELPRIPSLFPDLPVVGALLIALQSQRWTFLLFGGLQGLAFIYAGGWLAARLSGRSVLAGSVAMLALLSLLAALHLVTGGAPVLMTAFEPVTHFGPFLLSLIAAGLAARQVVDPDRRRLAGLAAVGAMVFVADPLLIVEFVAPLVATCSLFSIAGRLPCKHALACAGAVGLGVLVGLDAFAALLTLGMHFEGSSPLRPDVLLSAARSFARTVPSVVAEHPIALLLGCVLPVAAYAVFPVVAGDALMDPETRRARAFVWCYAGLAMAGSMVFTACFFVDVFSFRYLIAFWTWPLIFVAGTLLRSKRGIRVLPAVSAASCAACAMAYVFAAGGSSGLLHQDTDIVACLRQMRETLALHAGLAEYWDSRSVTAGLDWSTQVDQITQTGRAYHWGNDAAWYTHSLADPSRPPFYDFIVMRRLDPEQIRAVYGDPSQVLPCSDTVLWIYRDLDGLQPKLLAVSPELQG